MAGGAGVGAGLGIMGGTLGGIGDIISGLNYQRPHLEQATGMEQRLRQLAQSQLIGGGQQLLGATALYNQMAPILMSQLPGLQYIPGSGGQGTGGTSGAGGSAGNYGQALGNLQNAQGLQQQLTGLNAQIKGAKPGAARKGLVQQRKDLKRQIKSQPNVAQRERQAYTAGAQPGSFDIRMNPQSPTPQSSLASIQGLMAGLRGQQPSFTDIYNSAAG